MVRATHHLLIHDLGVGEQEQHALVLQRGEQRAQRAASHVAARRQQPTRCVMKWPLRPEPTLSPARLYMRTRSSLKLASVYVPDMMMVSHV